VEGDKLAGHVLRRIVKVEIVLFIRPPVRRVTLNCGHEFDVPRAWRPTVGKLTGCRECK
jgi:hypothetical protein